MAKQNKGSKRGGYGGRTIRPPDPWWKKLWGWSAKIVAAIVALLGAIATFADLQPGLVVDPQQHLSDIHKTEIVLKNDGVFDLEDVEVDLQFLWLELPRGVFQVWEGDTAFIGEKFTAAESIPRKESRQIRLPFLIQDQDIMGQDTPQFSFDAWQRVGVCLHVSFRSFPYLSWRAPPYSRVTRHYGLMADREDTTITLSQKRSCRYVERWLRDHAISAAFKDVVMVHSGRYRHRYQRQGQQP